MTEQGNVFKKLCDNCEKTFISVDSGFICTECKSGNILFDRGEGDLRERTIFQLRSEGKTLREIGISMGVSYQRVNQILRRRTESRDYRNDKYRERNRHKYHKAKGRQPRRECKFCP